MQRKGNIVLILVAVVAIAAVLAAGYLFFRNGQGRSVPREVSWEECTKDKTARIMESYPARCVTDDGKYATQPISEEEKKDLQPPTETTDTESKTVDGQQYKNSTHGFSVTLPGGLIIYEEESGGPVTIYNMGPTQKTQTEHYDGVSLRFTSAVLMGESLKEVAEQELKQGGEQIKPFNLIELAGKNGYTFRTRGLGEHTYIYLPMDNDKYLLIIDSTNDPTNQGYQQIAGGILATLKLQ